MRLTLVTLMLLGLALAQPPPQQGGGLLNSFRNFFRPRRQNPPPQQGFQFQPNQQQQFQPQQNSIPQNQGFQQQQPQQQNNNFRQSPPQQQQQQQQPQNGGFRQQEPEVQLSNSFKKCHVAEAAPFCPTAPPNHNFGGKNYLLTWNISCTNCECSKFSGEEAAEYCKSMGAQAVSLDTKAKADHFLGVSAQWAQRYYWTGGRMQWPKEELLWPSGVSEKFTRGQGYWSHTGGADDKGPQPDNRNQVQDGCEPEFCVGVLNNFYADGIKWHDIACHHKKPTICEFP